MDTKAVTADEVLAMLSDKARNSREGSMVALKTSKGWRVGRLTTSAGMGGGQGLPGIVGDGMFHFIARAEKVLTLD